MENIDIEKKRKFIEIATKRVNNVKDSIRILSNCSNDSYEYGKEDVDEMMTALQEILEETGKRFRERFKKDIPFEFSSSLNLDNMKENFESICSDTLEGGEEDEK